MTRFFEDVLILLHIVLILFRYFIQIQLKHVTTGNFVRLLLCLEIQIFKTVRMRGLDRGLGGFLGQFLVEK